MIREDALREIVGAFRVEQELGVGIVEEAVGDEVRVDRREEATREWTLTWEEPPKMMPFWLMT